eukprot:7863232-Pyramimonas_sp.AAC.1
MPNSRRPDVGAEHRRARRPKQPWSSRSPSYPRSSMTGGRQEQKVRLLLLAASRRRRCSRRSRRTSGLKVGT